MLSKSGRERGRGWGRERGGRREKKGGEKGEGGREREFQYEVVVDGAVIVRQIVCVIISKH